MKAKDDAPSARPLTAPDRSILGLPRKVWMLLGACLGLMVLSRIFSSSPHTVPAGHYTAAPGLLTPADYLNASASDPPPFPFCPTFGPNDTIAERRGQHALLKTQLHLGSGARIQRVIQKGLRGQPVTISVLGSSVSACHGAGDDVVSPRCWPSRFFDWWNSVFPHSLSELTNGAERKTDSSYFAYCSMHHLPDKTDLVILDFDTSDPNDPQWMRHFELLVRSILVRPEQPAIILIGHFAPQILVQHGFAGPELLHDVVAQFYDVPHLSLKGLLYQDYMVNPEGTRQSYYTDMVLASPAGHELISDIIIAYMQGQICSGWAAIMGHSFDVPYMGGAHDEKDTHTHAGLDASDEEIDSQGGGAAARQRAMKVPSVRLSDPPSAILKFREVKPFCMSANDLINPLPPSHFFGSGWFAHHPKKGASDTEARHYWWSGVPGSRMRVPIKVSAGEVAVYYIQHPEGAPPLGRAACWVDDDYANRVELSGVASVDDISPTLTIINEGVEEGDHYVECELVGDGAKTPPFKMLGIFAT